MQQEFAKYWARVRGRTLALTQHIPIERIDWSPGHGAMIIGDILRHLAVTERWLFVEIARGGHNAYESHGPELAGSLEDILNLMAGLHAESLAILDRFTPDDWRRQVTTPAGATMPAWKWLRAMVEHEAHHRGQLYLTLRLCGARTPPIFGLTSEQIRGAQP